MTSIGTPIWLGKAWNSAASAWIPPVEAPIARTLIGSVGIGRKGSAEPFLAGGPSDLPLNGWYLTDDPAALQKWRFPSVTMAAGGYLVVFASGKNRIDPASELHTNFKLDASGEYLALIKPDGLTVAQEFAPHYPPQREDISYGIGEEVVGAKLVGDGALAKFFVPADDALGLKWTGAPEDEPFDDSTQAGWTSATTGIGFDVSTEPIQPLAYWSFDDVSNPGQALDSSGFANHGVITSHFALAGRGASSKPVYSPDGGGHTGRPGDRALDFGARGDGALVQVPSAALGAFDSATENDAITISAWLFGSSDQPADDVVFWGSSEADGIGIRSLNAHVPWSDATIYWDTSGCCDGTQRIFKAESDSTEWRGRWNHYVFVKDGDLKQIWQNGSLFHHGTNTADLTLIRGFFIGGSLNNGEWSYGGLIDDFAVWDRALTASQIQSLAGGASPLALSSLSPLVGTDSKSAMLGKSASVYLRIPFDFGGSRDFNSLLLRMKYNDGFVAYLNGVEVARRNAPAAVRFDSSSVLSRAKGDAFTFEDIRLDAYLDHLQPGRNILAIHGLNGRADSPDFLIFPELVAARSSTGRFLSPPTPGAANVAGVLGFVANTQFGLERGFFKEPVDVDTEVERQLRELGG